MEKPRKVANLKFNGFEPAIRKNWGYWDGVAARERGMRWPEWCKPWQNFETAHFDKAYGEGFRIGWYNYEPPAGAMGA